MLDTGSTTDRPVILFVCTGNAARSVMAATLLRHRTDVVVVESAGTHSIPGLPMSSRTRAALANFDVADPHHLSAQLDDEMAERATMIAVFEPMHVSYVRKKHPDVAARLASLPLLARDLAKGPATTLAERLQALELANRDFEPWEEVVDPAGGDQAEFTQAAAAIDRLLGDLGPKIGL